MAKEIISKKEIVDKLAAEEDLKKLTKADLTRVLNAFCDLVTDELADQNEVRLVGFGKFEVQHRAARKGRNPQTGDEIDIPAKNVPTFKAGKALKDAVAHK